MLQYHPDHPLRPTDWRWERARVIRESGNKFKSKRKEDNWVRAAYKFQKDLEACRSDYDKYELMERYPDIYFAYAIRGNDDKKTLTVRSEIEARLLANESNETLADRCGCTAGTVECFEKLFFNVREKLKNTTYILHQALGPAIYKGLHEREHDLLWKLYGYFCGSYVIDALTTTFTKSDKPDSKEQVDALFIDDTKQVMRRKAAIAARTVGVNEFTQLRLLEIYAQFLEIEKDADGSGSGESLILDNIKSMMGGLPWATGTNAEEQKNTVVVVYDNNHAELRANEVLEIGAGIETSEQKELINMKFPEAPKRDKIK